jgi:hypothetical protein
MIHLVSADRRLPEAAPAVARCFLPGHALDIPARTALSN